MWENDDSPTVLRAGIQTFQDAPQRSSFLENAGRFLGNLVSGFSQPNTVADNLDGGIDTSPTRSYQQQPHYQFGYQNYKAPELVTHSHSLDNTAAFMAGVQQKTGQLMQQYQASRDVMRSAMRGQLQAQKQAMQPLREKMHQEFALKKQLNKLNLTEDLRNGQHLHSAAERLNPYKPKKYLNSVKAVVINPEEAAKRRYEIEKNRMPSNNIGTDMGAVIGQAFGKAGLSNNNRRLSPVDRIALPVIVELHKLQKQLSDGKEVLNAATKQVKMLWDASVGKWTGDMKQAWDTQEKKNKAAEREQIHRQVLQDFAEIQEKQRLADEEALLNKQKHEEMYKFSLNLNEQYQINKINTVEALIGLSNKAAKLSENNPDKFLEFMNDAIFGNYKVPFIDFIGKHKRLFWGDKGFDEGYRDNSKEQTYHFWAYVNYGFKYGRYKSELGNILHEAIEPGVRNITKPLHDSFKELKKLSETGSKEDFRLSQLGYELGSSLKNGTIMPESFSDIMAVNLRTRNIKYDLNAWIPFLPKAR